MKIILSILLFSATVVAQAPSDLPPETVVATVDGTPVTVGQLMAVMQITPADAQKGLLKDPKMFIGYIGTVRKLAELAEKQHLDRESPIKETLEAQRMLTMATSKLNSEQTASTVSAEEQKKFYEVNRDLLYSQAKVKILYVAFSENPSPKALSEPQAKAKIEKLLAQIRGGADFVKLVKENSDDAVSKANGGDFGTQIRRSDNLPPDILKAIFGLKPGEVSDPVRTVNGFYLYRLEELIVEPYDQVKNTIFTQIQAIKFQQWYQGLQKGVKVEITKPEFFAPPPAGAATGTN